MKFTYQGMEYELPCVKEHSEFIHQNFMISVR